MAKYRPGIPGPQILQLSDSTIISWFWRLANPITQFGDTLRERTRRHASNGGETALCGPIPASRSGVGCVVREPWGLAEPPWEAAQIDPELVAGCAMQSFLQPPKGSEPLSARRRRAARLARQAEKRASRHLLPQSHPLPQSHLHSTRTLDEPTTDCRRAATLMQDIITNRASAIYSRSTEGGLKALSIRR